MKKASFGESKRGVALAVAAQICIAGSVARRENLPTPALSPGQSTASECEWMRKCQPFVGRAEAWKSVALSGIAIFFLSTSTMQAQDVAEAAHQEQSHRATQKNSPKHVYTEEDLKKKTILTPADQAKVAARKQHDQQVPDEEHARTHEPAQQQDAPAESLGEVARRYRLEKASREAEEATKKDFRPFSYEVPQVTTAAPKAGVAPVIEITPQGKRPDFPELIWPEARRRPSQGNSAKARVSPFQPRPLSGVPPAVSVSARPSIPAMALQAVSPLTTKAQGRSDAAVRTIEVQRGDSWWKLAAQYLGSGTRWTELRALNPQVVGSPDMLRYGVTVHVPDGKNLPVISSNQAGQTQVRMKAGDTLWALAREHLGRGSAWTCLVDLNPLEDHRRMAIGTVVVLPEAGLADSCGSSKAARK
jgi:nucleoid-associated protein YgaU